MVTVRVKTDPVNHVTSTMWSSITGLHATVLLQLSCRISIHDATCTKNLVLKDCVLAFSFNVLL